MKVRHETDSEGWTLRIETDVDHVSHDTEGVETLWDNPVEHTRHRHCHDCGVGFREYSVTIESMPEWTWNEGEDE